MSTYDALENQTGNELCPQEGTFSLGHNQNQGGVIEGGVGELSLVQSFPLQSPALSWDPPVFQEQQFLSLSLLCLWQFAGCLPAGLTMPYSGLSFNQPALPFGFLLHRTPQPSSEAPDLGMLGPVFPSSQLSACVNLFLCSHLSAFRSPGMVPPGFSSPFPTYLISQPD